ncbi:MAG TPA: methylated-DNA--[protein]-cysteine S-methyltransferase [Candidatus Limnocylindrales bacterium]|nr:methylated-DNA--[protein]-cysteine S-methyltransferase [Candidatus Limnocylindrales bacterium]
MPLRPAAVWGARWATVDAPWGPVHVAATARGVVAVGLLTPTELFVAGLERRVGGEVRGAGGSEVRSPGGASSAAAVLDRAVAEIEEFLDGRRRSFDLPLDLADRPAWDRAVLGAVREVPWGEVTSYGGVARAVDRPGAARAVGGAVGRNPIALLVPCHRVIAGDGSLGGYGGDWYGSREEHLALKRELLAREGVAIPSRH